MAIKNGDKATIQALKKDPDYVEPCVIKDGYDTVPWHMRISTRNQAIPDLQYLDLTVD